MNIPTIELAKPTISYPLPNDHQTLMDLFYGYWQAAAAQTREHNEAVSKQAKADGVEVSYGLIGVDTDKYAFRREPRQAEIAALFPPKVNAAVILGNMNGQIENGGWSQYRDNGYSASIEAALTLYKGAADAGIEKADLVVAMIEEFIQRSSDDDSMMREYDGRSRRYFSDDEEQEEPELDRLDDLCTRYYAIEDRGALMQAMLDRFDEIVAGAFMAGAYKKAA